MKNILKFKGTIGRQQWWITMLLLMFPAIYIEAMIKAFDSIEPTLGSLLIMFTTLFLALFVWYVKLTVSVARIKETGGKWLVGIVPIRELLYRRFRRTILQCTC